TWSATPCARRSTRSCGGRARPGPVVTLLSVRDLHVSFPRRGHAPTVAVDGVGFDIEPGDTVGVVGESGCGKSVTSLAIMRLLPRHAEVSGSVELDGRDLLRLPERELLDVR